MKLRNKKTGLIIDFEERYGYSLYDCGDKIILGKNSEEPVYGYATLKEFNEDWEDYNPKEPLIKDEKIRKAVRAWAEANGIGDCICKEEIHCITFETERGMFISFENADTMTPEGNYTITELCGEEEE